MPQTVNIPDIGAVNFPDSMSEDQITAAIQEHILPDHRAATMLVGDTLMGGPRPEMDKSFGQVFLEEASKPFVEIPKPTSSPEDPNLAKFGKGMIQSGIGAIEGLESPLGVSLGAASFLPGVGKAVGRTAAAGFGVHGILEGFKEAASAYQSGDYEMAGRALGNVLIGSGIVRSAVGKTDPAVAPKTAVAAAAAKVKSDLRATVDIEKPVAIEELPPPPKQPDVPEVPEQTAVANVPAEQTAPAKWATATAEDTPAMGTELYSGIPNPVAVAKSVAKMAKDVGPYLKAAAEAGVEKAKDIGTDLLMIGDVSDYRRSVLNWSAKLQRSFGEAAAAQKDIQSVVKDPVKDEAITNWIQADGDPTVLQARANVTTDPDLKAGYEAALNLTPEEIAVAKDVQNAYAALGQRGMKFDVLKSFKDNYVTQIWDLGKGPATGSTRTLRERFRFSKASVFPTFFDGEQAGYKPKTKRISELLPVYLHEMNQVIAARQLVQELIGGVEKDGRPILAPRGQGMPVDNPAGKATLIMPKAIKGSDTSDYIPLARQPALSDWRWAAQDTAGNPIFLKADLAVHPDAFDKLNYLLGRSAIREWYQSKTSAAAGIPKAIVRGIDRAQSETKRTMLGLLATFHQVQEGTHAIGHRISPFGNIPKIDLVNDASQMDAARHGLMLLPDRASADQFMEGFRVSGLISKMPVIGAIADAYSDYLFHQYIPGLKYKTYQAILERNKGVYESELNSGSVALEDVKVLSAEQANAAYGHLNYADLAKNPTVQHFWQLALLAPDFLEARGRFAGQAAKGIIGLKSGREQAVALGALATAQASAAYVAAQLSGGEWDKKDPFTFHVGNRKYTMRSVPEDVTSLVKDWRPFTYSRLNPLLGRGTLQFLTGVDWRGQHVTAAETAKELAQQPIPLSLRAFLGTSKSSLNEWEQLAGTIGLKISRYDPYTQLRTLISDWKKSSNDPRLIAEAERAEKETLAQSDYSDLRHALIDNDMKKAKDEFAKLTTVHTAKQITQAMKPNKPVTGSRKIEELFVNSLTPEQRKTYDAVVANRQLIWERFQAINSGETEQTAKDFSIKK